MPSPIDAFARTTSENPGVENLEMKDLDKDLDMENLDIERKL